MLKGKLIYIFLLVSFFSFGQQMSKMLLASIQQASVGVSTVPVVESFTQTIYTSGTNTMTANKPTGVVSGDFILVIQSNSTASDNAQYDDTSDPVGWTFGGEFGDTTSDVHSAYYYKISDGTEGASFDFSLGALGATSPGYIVCIRISGVHTTPIGTVGTVSQGVATSIVVPEITTANANSLALYTVTTDGSDMAPFSVSGTGWSEGDEIDSSINGAGGAEGAWGTKDIPTAGLTGSSTVSWAVSDGYLGWLIEIRSE